MEVYNEVAEKDRTQGLKHQILKKNA
jgi:hypothetical protein